MNEFESLGKYIFYRELAESHLLCIRVCNEVMAEMIVAAQNAGPAGAVDSDRARAIIATAEKSRLHYRRCAKLANEAASLCGREPLNIEEPNGVAA